MTQPGTRAARNLWKPFVICPDTEMSRRIRSALGVLGLENVYYVSEYPPIGTLAGLMGQQGSNICFVDVGSNQEHALLLVAEAALMVTAVALHPRNDADLILRCLRRGASEFLSDPTAEQAAAVLDRLGQLRAPSAAPQKAAVVYGVVPGKPGCGASTLAAYLAIEMKRSGADRVLLVDTDALSGSITFLLKLKADFHLGDAVRDWKRMDDDLWGRLTARCHGIDVLPAPENPATPVEIDRQAVLQLLAFWREHYDAIVLDLPGLYAEVFDFVTVSDEILLVTTNELAALHATRRSLEFLEKNAVDCAKVKLVVTRYTPATGLSREDVKTALKLEPYALLDNNYKAVQDAVLDGNPVSPASPLGRSIHAFTERLLGKEKPSPKRAPFFGLLAKRA